MIIQASYSSVGHECYQGSKLKHSSFKIFTNIQLQQRWRFLRHILEHVSFIAVTKISLKSKGILAFSRRKEDWTQPYILSFLPYTQPCFSFKVPTYEGKSKCAKTRDCHHRYTYVNVIPCNSYCSVCAPLSVFLLLQMQRKQIFINIISLLTPVVAYLVLR